MGKKKMSLYKVLKGTVMGIGYAASAAGGYVTGMYVAEKIYERTGDYLPATIAGGMAGVAVTEAGIAVVDLAGAKVDTTVKRKECEKLAADNA